MPIRCCGTPCSAAGPVPGGGRRTGRPPRRCCAAATAAEAVARQLLRTDAVGEAWATGVAAGRRAPRRLRRTAPTTPWRSCAAPWTSRCPTPAGPRSSPNWARWSSRPCGRRPAIPRLTEALRLPGHAAATGCARRWPWARRWPGRGEARTAIDVLRALDEQLCRTTRTWSARCRPPRRCCPTTTQAIRQEVYRWLRETAERSPRAGRHGRAGAAGAVRGRRPV